MNESTLMKKPNFFILGAAKCGTTSLYYQLKEHPDIFMSDSKEPSFFMDRPRYFSDPIRYFELFDPVNGEKAIGEASGAYLTDPSSARVLRLLFPDAKFIVILRNPADRAYSLYHFMRMSGLERNHIFEKALLVEEERETSQTFYEHCPAYFYNYLYFRSGLYGEQIERYLSFFERSQFHFLTLEQLNADPRLALSNIFEFLEVYPEFEPESRAHNTLMHTTRSAMLQSFWTIGISQFLCHCHMNWLSNLGTKMMWKFNIREKPPMDPQTRESLLARYADDSKKLYELTGISL